MTEDTTEAQCPTCDGEGTVERDVWIDGNNCGGWEARPRPCPECQEGED